MTAPAATGRAAGVELAGVRKEYESGVVAVHEIDLTVQAGEFVVLVGPSGCGKSTTLRMIAGLETISAGTLRIGDRIVNEVPPADRNIAMVFQSYALYPHMTVRENMAFALRIQKRADADIAARVNAAAATLDITPLLDRQPRQLSGGQRQRVAIGRAIVREPAVFLFDEPLSNLDAALRGEMRREIGALHRRLGATMIYVTHDQIEAMTLGDRIVVMHQGRVRQCDAPSRVYDQPADTFVAGFLGSPPMNIVQGTFIRRDGVPFVRLTGAPAVELSLPAWLPASVATEGKGVTVGMRPEHLRVSADRGAGFEGIVELAEVLGHEQLLHLRVGDVRLTARGDGGERTPAGTAVRLHGNAERLHFFDVDTGKTLRAGP